MAPIPGIFLLEQKADAGGYLPGLELVIRLDPTT
jgi:hypothetical protein